LHAIVGATTFGGARYASPIRAAVPMLGFFYRALYDSLATVDVAGGVLLVSIWFQTGYVALFRAMHGDDAGREYAPAVAPRRVGPSTLPSPTAPRSPWAR
jgi:hypothetical protein